MNIDLRNWAHEWRVWCLLLFLLLVLLLAVGFASSTSGAHDIQVADLSVPNLSISPDPTPKLTGPQLDATKQAWLDNEQKRRDDAKTRVAQNPQPSRTLHSPPTPKPQPTPGLGLASCGGDKYFSITTCWGGKLNDEFVYVAAGSLSRDPSEGAIQVHTTTLYGNLGSPFLTYSSLQKEGSLTIAYVDMPRVTLIVPHDGRPTTMFVFNLQTRQWEATVRCQIYPIAFRDDTFSNLPMKYYKKEVPLNTADGGANTGSGTGDGSFAWLSFTQTNSGKKDSTGLPAPGESGTFTNPDNPSDHTPSTGDWIQGQQNISADPSMRSSFEFLKAGGFIIPVALWDKVRGQGANLQYHVSGFAWVYVADHTAFPPTNLSVMYWGSATCSDK